MPRIRRRTAGGGIAALLALVALVTGAVLFITTAFAAPATIVFANAPASVAQNANVAFDVNTSGASPDQYKGFNIGLLWQTTGTATVTFGNASNSGSVINSPFCPAPAQNTPTEVVFACTSLGAATTVSGKLAGFTFTTTGVGCVRFHLITRLAPDNGGAARGTYLVSNGVTQPAPNNTPQSNPLASDIDIPIGGGSCVFAPTATPSATATNTVQPTATNTAQPTATNTAIPTATNTVQPTATNTVQPTATNTAIPTATNTVQATATNTAIPTATNTVQATATNTVMPTATNTVQPTATNTTVAGDTATPSATATETAVLTSTNTPSPTATAEATNTAVPTSTNTPSPTATAPATNTAVPTSTNTPSPTATAQATNTAIPTATNTSIPTATNTSVSAPTSTRTSTATATPVTPTDECLSLGQKLGLAIGIILRLDVVEGERHYKSKYDVNGDSVIDFDDLAEVVLTPVCKKGRR